MDGGNDVARNTRLRERSGNGCRQANIREIGIHAERDPGGAKARLEAVSARDVLLKDEREPFSLAKCRDYIEVR